MAGLAPGNIRLPANEDTQSFDGGDVIVQMSDDAADSPDVNERGDILRIEHGDGSVTVSLNGQPIEKAEQDTDTGNWFKNLCEDVDDMELGRIANELLRGISDDITSRAEWIEDRAQGVKLLGLKLEVPGLQGASDGAPVEGMSKVRDPLLLEAVLRFQANARSELLPTDGPVKIRDDQNGNPPQMGHNGGPPMDPSMVGSTLDQDQLADALEKDLNHYLTAVATEYYPDTDRMLLMLGFGGTAFKKVYYCPLRKRPISETVDADDLIVNNSATDLRNAKRATHRSMMPPSTVKRLQILGVYRDVDLSTPMPQKLDSLQREEKAQQGLQTESNNPEDRDREIYECYCELNISGFEHKHKGKISGLDIPYRVTIDVSSQQILAIVRDYDEETKELPEKRKSFVNFTFVPGFGFLGIGLLHILGNITNALTAATREMLDNGMFANFPGFLQADVGGRQLTNIFRIPPGGAAQVKTNGMDIRQAIMPLPYNTTQMAPLMALVQALRQEGMRIGGTSEQQVGEGRADAPVGTTLAMIDQATKVLNSVHKRMHAAQAEEFKLLVECFREHPESFVNMKCPSKTKWTEDVFIKALNDCDLVPQADPNTASHSQRVMKIMALKQLQAASPQMYDPIKIDTAALQAIGWSNPQQFFAPPEAQAAPPPELQEIQAGIKAAQQLADAKTTEANAKTEVAKAKTAEVQAKAEQGGFAAKPGLAGGEQQQVDTPVDKEEAKAKMLDAQTNRQELGLKAKELATDTANEEADRQNKTHLAVLDLAEKVMGHGIKASQARQDAKEADKMSAETAPKPKPKS